ncbi:hypothetical protein VDGL01_01592 [Verticillium dahliae]
MAKNDRAKPRVFVFPHRERTGNKHLPPNYED